MRLQLDSSITGAADNRTGAIGSGSAGSSLRGGDAAGLRDSISISGTAAALNLAASDRAGRIQQISDAVRSDRYQISSSVLAGAIVAQAGS